MSLCRVEAIHMIDSSKVKGNDCKVIRLYVGRYISDLQKRTEKLKLNYFPANFYKNHSENGLSGNLTGFY